MRKALFVLLIMLAAGATLLADVRVIENVSYGAHPDQRFDVYSPRGVRGAPVIFFLHGGGWRRGDKDSPGVAGAKMRHWTSKGFVFISANYPMLPDADPLEQARHVVDAVKTAQRRATEWGGDPTRFVLMGHSAGAHLAALVTADPQRFGLRSVVATVSLDSGALDVPMTMNAPHFPLFDEAFGSDPAFWRATSPYHQLARTAPPMLVVCSSERRVSCPQADHFASRARELGVAVEVLPVPLSHREINVDLGKSGSYTASVDRFIARVVR
jgi:arylformamidase